MLGWGVGTTLPMLLSARYGCRARRRSFAAAGMALALAGRAAGLVPALHPTASVRSSSRQLLKATAATTTTPLPVRASATRRRYWGVAVKGARAALSTGVGVCGDGGRVMWPASSGARIMSSFGSSGALFSTQSSYEMTAGDLALEAQIKSKGDAIRDLKAGGASKDELKPHIEVCILIEAVHVGT